MLEKRESRPTSVVLGPRHVPTFLFTDTTPSTRINTPEHIQSIHRNNILTMPSIAQATMCVLTVSNREWIAVESPPSCFFYKHDRSTNPQKF